MLTLLSATGLIAAATVYAAIVGQKMISGNLQCQYAMAYCHTRLHH